MTSGAVVLKVLLSLGESAAGGVVSKVASLATDKLKFNIVWSFDEELEKLKQLSTQIANMIHDAALEPEDLELWAMADWMKRLVSLAYAAEDVVDEVQYEAVRIRIEGPVLLDKKERGFFFPLPMAGKIDNINKSLENLRLEAPSVLLVTTRRSNGGAASSQGRRDWETTSLLEKHEFTSRDAKIFGREDVVSDITATLNDPNNEEKMLLVMAIVGLAGVGKTTLARLLTKQLMKEGEMKKPFHITLWVYVSQTFDVNSILSRMVESCKATTANLSGREGLIQRLREELKGKRYFLVLDDVWNEDPQIWQTLKECLRHLESAKGSTVIVTTRSARVAEIMRTLPNNCDLGILSVDECWSIIKDRAFNDPSLSIDSEQERIGRKIAEKCAGLPLAAKILGSLMHSKNSIPGWLSILQSPAWQNSIIMPALMLSFDDLEPLLKPCFAYCSMLDKGSLIKRDELIQLWMAQGFLNPSHPCQRTQKREMEMEMEDIGNEYFDTLLEKSLFQDATKDEDDVITECKMHDRVHEFAIEVSKCESWTPNFNQKMDHSEIRHAAQIPTSEELESMPETSIARLRSLFSNVQVSNIIFSKLRALRVLSFYEVWTQKLPNSLDKLKHLRYLDLSHTAITELPESIGKLYNLQTLRLPYLDKWPKEIQNLINLRHLDLSRTAIKELPESIDKLSKLQTLRLPYLDKCPKEIQNLINLRHLYVDERMNFEAGILGQLTNLRRLRYFNAGKEIGPAIEELGGLNQLRGHLIMDGLEHVRDREEAKKACLVQKSHLHELTFKWTDGGVPNENQTDVLDGLEPHDMLQRLNIEYFMGARFPSWIKSLQNLKEIRLVGCNNCEGVPTLGHLPKLRSLELRKMHKLKSVGAECDGTRTTLFPELKTLDISECQELIEWMEAPAEGEVEVFPCLEELEVSLCPNLGNAPSRFPCLKTLKIYQTGLTCLPEGMSCLTYLKIHGCDELNCIAPDVFGCCKSLRSLIVTNCKKPSHLDGLEKLPHLEVLSIGDCPSLKSIRITQDINRLLPLEELTILECRKLAWIRITPGIASLRVLNIDYCEELSILEVGLDNCTSLQYLRISYCANLTSITIPECMPSLWTLSITWCEGLSSLDGLVCCTSLKDLELCHCHNLTSINLTSIPITEGSKSLQITEGIKSLQWLKIDGCLRLLSLYGLQSCTSLEDLQITDCPSLGSIQITQGIASLRKLNISGCQRLSSLEVGFDNCTSLEDLQITYCPRLWSIQITQGIASLRKLNISGCQRLSSLEVGFDNCTSLEDLQITDCPSLGSIQITQGIASLRKLNISGCARLSSLEVGFDNCTSLEDLQITDCPRLGSIQITQGIASLRKLNISWCQRLEVGFDNCTSLEDLQITDCPRLGSIQITQGIASLRKLNISGCERLSSLEVGFDNCTSLEDLQITDCPRLGSIQITVITQGFASLQSLTIDNRWGLLSNGLQFCTSLQRLQITGNRSIPITQGIPSLQSLTIADCPRLLSLPSGLQFCTSLQDLQITDCPSLELIQITQGIPSLQSLTIVNCPKLLSLPSGLQFCTALEDLEVRECSSLVSISVSYHVCDHPGSTNQPEEVYRGVVQYLSIQEDCRCLEFILAHLRQSLKCNCGKLKYEPTGLFHSLTSLKKLKIGGFWRELDAFPDFQLPPPHDSQLVELNLVGWSELMSQLPQQIQHFTCLKTLSIDYFRGIEAFPEWLGNLTSLEYLKILYCIYAKYLPTQDAMKRLTKLKKLSIIGCPKLETSCTKETGPEWPKISHIPLLEFSGRYGIAEISTSSPINAENSSSSPRIAEISTSSPIN